MDDLSTQKQCSMSQSLCAESIFGISLNRRGFLVTGLKGHPRRSGLGIGENCRLCPFSVCCDSNFEKGTDNVINRIFLIPWYQN